ncbi:hypothetical protein [Zhenpiania hominis]|uniref:hypothetical protein n=1 Tax=Zhenpiania hominis TaxID=2763644 RepID=UPI0039F49205
MKNKSAVFKEYSTALLTIGSVVAGTFNCLFYYVYDMWMYVYFLMNILIISALIYLCWRIHDKFMKEDGLGIFYLAAIAVVIPFALGSFLSLVFAIE